MKRGCVIGIILFLVGFQSCYKEEIVFNVEVDRELELSTILKINKKECCFDYTENTLRFPINADIINDFSPLIEFQEYSNVFFEGKSLKINSVNNLGKIEINKEYEIIIETNNNTKKLQLTFTNLPIVQVITPNRILDEPKTIAKIIVNDPARESCIISYIGIEYRGSHSLVYDKKSFNISFLNSQYLGKEKLISIFNYKKNNRFILDAMYIDRARLRNNISFKIWRKIENERNYGIESKFVELFINNEHQGLYCFNETLNAELLDLTNNDALLYKGIDWTSTTTFEAIEDNISNNELWAGWEQKYPNPKDKINWLPIYSLTKDVVNLNNSNFQNEIPKIINIDNFIDYYLFINLIQAIDNMGLNTFIARTKKSDRLFILPWDLDASYGISWDGSYIDHTSILSNNLFDRLIETNTNDFKNKLKQRWSFLRGHIFSNIELKKVFNDNFILIKKSEIIDIENKKWGSNIDINLEQEYLIDWIENRLSFLDNYFDNL